MVLFVMEQLLCHILLPLSTLCERKWFFPARPGSPERP
jgi:hypothetical protein